MTKPTPRVFAVRIKKHWVLGYSLSAQQRMIRLGRCPGWFESWLGAPIILLVLSCSRSIIEPRHDKTNKMSVRPMKTQISLCICPDWSVFAVSMKKAWVLSCPLSAEPRLIRVGGCPSAQADLSLRWTHTHFVGFVMSWLIFRTVTGFVWQQDRAAP